MICVNSVTVSPSRITIKAGEWYYGAKATVCPSNANCCGVTWSSANTAIASVNSSSGYIYAKTAGTTRIYATATDGSGQRGYIDVTVSNTISVSAIELRNTSLEKGESCSLEVTVVPENATNNVLAWNSSNTNVVTVNDGVVHAVSEGSATITATATDGSGVSACCSVTVTHAILAGSVRMCPASVTLVEGTGTYLGATVCPENTTNPCVLWTSEDANIATVNPISGYVSALKEGTVTIYATVQDGSNARGSCEVTVDPKIPVRSVTVSANVQSIDVGDKAYCTAIICPEDATNKAVRWSSSDPNVATVGTYTGRVTGKAPGVATIIAETIDGGLTSQLTLNVGHSTVIDGHKITVLSSDDEILDPAEDMIANEICVYANDVVISSARKETNGDITVCVDEIARALCTDYEINTNKNRFYFSTFHSDLNLNYEKTYNRSDFGLCAIHNTYDRISLTRFVNDLGYSSKYDSIPYTNGSVFVAIQGPGQYATVPLDELAAGDVVSLALGFIPGFGDCKDIAEGLAGYDLITGEELSAFDRCVSIALTFIPVLSGGIFRVGKKGITKIDNLLRYADNLADIQQAVIRSDIWKILRPLTRGLCIEVELARTVYKLADGWHHIGKAMNGFFPVIDFLKVSDNLDETIAISLKTLDPQLYRLADGSYDIARLKRVINTYIEKLAKTPMFIEDVEITCRQLDLVVPKGFKNVINEIKDQLNLEEIIFNLMEL